MVRLARPRTLILALAAIGLALACTDNARTGNPLAPSFSNQGGVGRAYGVGHYRLAHCTTRSAHENTTLIGPAGGVLKVGPNRLDVPAGALDHKTVLTGQVLPLNAVNVEFGPEGLQFEVPAQLTLNTGGCAIPPNVSPVIVYVENGEVADVIPATFDRIHNKISGLIHHFSGYSVAFADDE